MKKGKQSAHCQICKKLHPLHDLFPIQLIRTSLLETAKQHYPNLIETGYICSDDLKIIRNLHIEQMLKESKGELSTLDKTVLESLQEHELISENVNKKFEKSLTFGERLADKIAKYGGSWPFIISFLVVIGIWVIINSIHFLLHSFDPYPYILLNLLLSCLAAIQAPVIMMSQNRQAQKDRLQSDDDYCTNLKAELEIRQLHAKLDIFMKSQWDRLIELQQIQIDLAEDLLEQKKEKPKTNKNP